MAPILDLAGLAEGELVQRFRAGGDGQCFAELYRRERRAVFGVCLHILREPARAEDLCHEAFVRAFEGFAGLRGDAFGPWVRRIARNLCLNEIRHRAVERNAPPDPPANASTSAEDTATFREELSRAIRIIGTLSEPQRRVFLLRHLDGCSHREISELTGMNPNEIRSRLQNARRNFNIAWRKRTGAMEDSGHG